MNALLAHGERKLDARRDELTHEARKGVQADLERIRRWFAEDFDRSGTAGVAVFACAPDGLFRTLSLAAPVDDALRLDRDLMLAPLVRLVGKGDGPLVAVVNRERGDVYRLEDGGFVQVADLTEEQGGLRRSDQGGWSQANYQRWFDEVAEKHMKDVAEELNRRVRQRRVPVVVVGPEEIRSEFVDALAQDARTALLGWAAVEAHATPAQVLDAISPLLEEAEAADEAELLERWRGRPQRGARDGRLGRHARGASDGARRGAARRGGREPDGVAVRGLRPRGRDLGAKCPLDGIAMNERDTASTSQCTGRSRTAAASRSSGTTRISRPAEGIGALLRY